MINIQNINYNQYFKWSLVRYANPTDHNPRRIVESNKDFPKKPDFKYMSFPVNIRDIHKIENKNSIISSVFGYEN